MNHIRNSVMVLLTLFGAATYAQDAAVDDKIMELLRVSSADQIVEGSHTQLQDLLFAEIDVNALSADQKKVLAKYQAEFTGVLNEELSTDRMLESSVRFYKELFSAEEIQYLIDFYSTPTGQKLANELPKQVPKIIEETQSLMTDFIPKMLDLRQRLNDELQGGQ